VTGLFTLNNLNSVWVILATLCDFIFLEPHCHHVINQKCNPPEFYVAVF
jgi:hypothetical protein